MATVEYAHKVLHIQPATVALFSQKPSEKLVTTGEASSGSVINTYELTTSIHSFINSLNWYIPMMAIKYKQCRTRIFALTDRFNMSYCVFLLTYIISDCFFLLVSLSWQVINFLNSKHFYNTREVKWGGRETVTCMYSTNGWFVANGKTWYTRKFLGYKLRTLHNEREIYLCIIDCWLAGCFMRSR